MGQIAPAPGREQRRHADRLRGLVRRQVAIRGHLPPAGRPQQLGRRLSLHSRRGQTDRSHRCRTERARRTRHGCRSGVRRRRAHPTPRSRRRTLPLGSRCLRQKLQSGERRSDAVLSLSRCLRGDVGGHSGYPTPVRYVPRNRKRRNVAPGQLDGWQQ